MDRIVDVSGRILKVDDQPLRIDDTRIRLQPALMRHPMEIFGCLTYSRIGMTSLFVRESVDALLDPTHAAAYRLAPTGE